MYSLVVTMKYRFIFTLGAVDKTQRVHKVFDSCPILKSAMGRYKLVSTKRMCHSAVAMSV
jgi:hypothetical protein